LHTAGAFADLMEQTDMRTIPLYGPKAAGRVALVDDEDYDLVMQYRWNILEQERPGHWPIGPYATTNLPDYGSTMLMHKLLTGWPQTDHADHNGLNNQRSNLRPARGGQNLQNARKRAGASSRFKGVSWDPVNQKWIARICVSGHQRNLGRHLSEEDAARAYDAAARAAFGEFACLNFPSGT
jgi:hypothetical protein